MSKVRLIVFVKTEEVLGLEAGALEHWTEVGQTEECGQ